MQERIRQYVSTNTGLDFQAEFDEWLPADEQAILKISIPAEEDVFAAREGLLVLEVINVPADMRRRGIGSKALAALEQAAKAEGIKTVGLHAFPFSDGEGNDLEDIQRLIRFYECHGYKLMYPGELEAIFESMRSRWGEDWDGLLGFGDVEDAVWMEKDL